MPANPDQPARLLLIDDDEIERSSLMRGIRRAEFPCDVVVARDGVEALDIMRGGAVDSIRAPYLVLLDLNMPRMHGLDVLQAIRSDEALKRATVFVFSTSDDPNDIRAAYDLGAAGYIVKDKAEPDFADVVRLLQDYWSAVALPME